MSSRLLASFIAPVLCGGCVAAATLPEPSPTPDPYVGRTLWTDAKHPVSLCDAPSSYGGTATRCEPLPAGTPLKIEEASYHQTAYVSLVDGYRVTAPNNRTGFISDLSPMVMLSAEAKQQKEAEKTDCDRRGGVRIGMTKEQVYTSCWGKPRKVNETVTAGGQHEQWVYGTGYIYLDNGVVRSIQTSR